MRRRSLIVEKSGLVEPELFSNPATPTNENRVFDYENPVLLLSDTCVADMSGTRKILRRKPLLSRNGYPYREPRIYPLDLDMKKTWYIVFYAFDLTTKTLVRKRVAKDILNDIHDRSLRISKAEQLINELNHYLERDFHLQTNPAPKILKFDFRGYTIIEAINYAMSYKTEVEEVRKGTIDEYISTRTTIEDFLQHAGLRPNYKLRDMDDAFIISYLDYLKRERKLSNKTYNNRRTILHAVCEVLIRRDPKLFFGVNPFKKFPMLKTMTKKHAAYTNEQMTMIKDAFVRGSEQHLVLFIQFMFYTLARPEELRHLKVGHIRINDRRILFVSEKAKTGIEEYVGINDRFCNIIQESGILEYPENYYVFSNDDEAHTPGEHPVSINYFYKRIVKYIEKLGFYELDREYTLYSFKHSGAISLYQATKDIKLLQQQCRHQNVEQTNIYLRDLGLFTDFAALNKWSGPL